MKTALRSALVLALLVAGCGASSSATHSRRTLCGAAAGACALVNAYCSQPEPEPEETPSP